MWTRTRAYGAPAVAGAFAAVLGLFALLGALTGAATLEAVAPGSSATGPIAAAAAIALGLALIRLDERREAPGRRAGLALALAVALTGATCLIRALLGAAGLAGGSSGALEGAGGTLGISPLTSALLLLLGVALASADLRRRAGWIHSACVLGAIGVELLAVVGWAYGIDWLRGGAPASAISPATVPVVLVLTLAAAGIRGVDGPLSLLHGSDAGARMTRVLLPSALLAPVALGTVRAAVEDSGVIGYHEALALYTLLMTTVLVALVVLVARRLRRADAQLRDLALLVEAADDAIVHQTLTGTIVGWNGAAERLYGYAPGEAIGQHISMLAPRDRRDEITEMLARAAAGEVSRIRTVWLSRDGAELEVALTFSPVGDGPGRVVGAAAVAHDITARREAERRSDRIAGMLAEAQRLAGLGSWEIDLATDAASCSDQAYAIFGTEPAAGPPDGRTPFVSLVHADDLAGYVEMLAAARESSEEGSVEYRVRRPDGEERIVHSRARRVDDGRSTRLLGTVMDVTEMRRLEREATSARDLFRGVLDSATETSIIGTGTDGVITVFNQGAERMLGRLAEDVVGRQTPLAFHDAGEVAARAAELGLAPGFEILVSAARAGVAETREWTYITAGGSRLTVSLTVSAIRDEDGYPTGFLAVARDVTEARRIADQLQHLADHDALTGLLNRHRFEAELERAVGESRRYGRSGGLMILDLDGFKRVNDCFGHPAGDELLQRVGGVLRSAVRSTDVVARLGGDEFAIILQEVSEDDALALAQEIRDRIGAATRVAGELYEPARLGEHAVTVSIGVSLFDGDTPGEREQLVVEADTAMYDAKAAGRDRCAVYSRTLDERGTGATPTGRAAPLPDGRTAGPR